MKQFCKNGHDTHETGRYKRGDCIACARAKAKKYFLANKELCHARNKAYLRKNYSHVQGRKLLYRKNNLHREALWKRQGIILTLAEYNSLRVAQNFMCPICWHKETNRQLQVDHDHKTGQIRGIICHKCNKGLGCFYDNTAILENAIQYLTPPLERQFEVI